MKKINILNFFLVLLFLGSFPVSGQDFVSSIAKADASYIRIQEADEVKNFLKDAGSQTLTVETNLALYAKSDKTWCTPTVSEKVVTIAVAQSNEEESRTAEVKIYGKDNKSALVRVIQLGTKPDILVNETSFELDQYTTGFSIGIASSVVFTFELPAWVKGPSVAPAIGFNTYEFTVDPITTAGEKREGEITIKTADNSVSEIKIPVTQTHVGFPRFAVISDIHFGNSQGEGPKVKVPKALKNIVAKGVDAIFVVGDLTENGTVSQYDDLLTVFNNEENIPADLPVYFMMGNHDNYSGANAATNYYKLGQPLHQYVEIKGYPFITVSMSGSSTDGYNTAEQDYLRTTLADAAANYPGKPIFVFTHVPPKYTVYGSQAGDGGWGTEKFTSILNNYPQVVIFSGHSHFPLGDPRSIYQDKFTAVNDGSTTYSEIEPNLVNAGIHPEKYAYVTEGVIVNLDGDMNIEMERWDTYRNIEILPRWNVNAPHDGSNFENEYKGRTGGEAPKFADGEKPVVSDVDNQGCKVTFNQATDDEVVHHYVIEIMEGSRVVTKFTKFSEFYLNNEMPLSFTIPFNGIPAGATLTARVTALDSYSNKSTPIESEEFTTLGRAKVWEIPQNFPEGKVVGLWEFNDSSNPGKATIGNDATLKGTASYQLVDGVGSIRVDQDPSGASYQNYISIDHGLASDDNSDYVRNYCLVLDAKLDLDKNYTSLYRFGSATDADIFARGDGTNTAFGAIGLNGGGLNYSPTLLQRGWNRIVVNAKLDKGTTSTLSIYVCYPDGTINKYERDEIITSPDRFSLGVAKEIMVAGDNDRENGNLNIAQLALINAYLTEEEITEILTPWTEITETLEIPNDFPEEKLVGLWEFNDSSNPGKATKGNDITLHGSANYREIDELGSVRIEQDAAGEKYVNYISIDHGLSSDDESAYKRNYCLIMDACLDLDKSYTALYRFGDNADADIFARGDGAGTGIAFGAVGLNGSGLGYSPTLLQRGWNRIVVNANITENSLSIYVCHPDGTINSYERNGLITNPDRLSITTANPIMVSGDDDRENGNLNIAQMALFDTYLTEEELENVLVPWTK